MNRRGEYIIDALVTGFFALGSVLLCAAGAALVLGVVITVVFVAAAVLRWWALTILAVPVVLVGLGALVIEIEDRLR